MTKYLGYSAQLALAQNADGTVDKWYVPGDDIELDDAQAQWLVGSGHSFDPMPDTAVATTEFEDVGSGPAMISPTQAGAMTLGAPAESPPLAESAPPAEETPHAEQQPA